MIVLCRRMATSECSPGAWRRVRCRAPSHGDVNAAERRVHERE
jgi:hypothetical protein